MKDFILLVIVSFAFHAYGRDIQNSECVGPASAPIQAVYLHGYYPPNGKPDNYYLNLEAKNRDRLEALANKLQIRIAIPVARHFDEKNRRNWLAGGTAKENFANMEADAAKVCGGPLATPRGLIGFSQGGFFSRDLALNCRNLVGGAYSSILMAGAKPKVPETTLKDCPRLVVTSGIDDKGTQTCSKRKKKKICVSFLDMAKRLKARYPNLEIATYPGGHILPPDDLLTGSIPQPNRATVLGGPAASK